MLTSKCAMLSPMPSVNGQTIVTLLKPLSCALVAAMNELIPPCGRCCGAVLSTEHTVTCNAAGRHRGDALHPLDRVQRRQPAQGRHRHAVCGGRTAHREAANAGGRSCRPGDFHFSIHASVLSSCSCSAMAGGNCECRCHYVLINQGHEQCPLECALLAVHEEALAPDTAVAAAPQASLIVKWSTTDANIATFDLQVFEAATGGEPVRKPLFATRICSVRMSVTGAARHLRSHCVTADM